MARKNILLSMIQLLSHMKKKFRAFLKLFLPIWTIIIL
nr:MAG TPA: hypothetical protein [Caudoviricetes sp.]